MFKKTLLFYYIFFSIVNNISYGTPIISDNLIRVYVEDLIKSYPDCQIQESGIIAIYFTLHRGLYAYRRSDAIFFPQLYKDLIEGIIQQKSRISVTYYEQNYKIDLTIPHECAFLFFKTTLFHEMGHMACGHMNSTKGAEIEADEYASRVWQATLGGIIGHRLLNLILLKGDKSNLAYGQVLHTFLPISGTHPSYYERELFFRKKLNNFLNNQENNQEEVERIFTLANTIEVKIKDMFTQMYHIFTNILQ